MGRAQGRKTGLIDIPLWPQEQRGYADPGKGHEPAQMRNRTRAPQSHGFDEKVVHPTGFEPVTPAFGAI